MKLITTVGPTIEPVTVREARDQVSLLDDITHDMLLAGLVTVAREAVEQITGLRCMTQTVRLELDGFPCGDVLVPVYPVSAVMALAYDDANGVEQSLVSGTDFWTDLGGMYPRLAPVSAWPATLPGKPGSVRITMTCGHATAAAVPANVRHAIKMRVAELFDHRAESVEAVSVAAGPLALSALLAPYVQGRL